MWTYTYTISYDSFQGTVGGMSEENAHKMKRVMGKKMDIGSEEKLVRCKTTVA